MLALVQPFGIGSPGGGARILSSLLAGSADRFVSICTAPVRPPPPPDVAIVEWHLPHRPAFGRIERSRLHPLLAAADVVANLWLTRRLVAAFREIGVTAVHLIPHSADFWPAYRAARRVGARVIVSVHDDLEYTQARSLLLPLLVRQLGRVWREADARLAISEELGQEYNRRFGDQSFTIVTDGVEQVADAARPTSSDSLRVHFGGAQHLCYGPNFLALVAALERIKAFQPGREVILTLRGAHLNRTPTGVTVRCLPWADQSTFEQDLCEADLLYLPLPFEARHLALGKYSLSTKMVTYLASGTPILYHGPADTAVGRLLGGHAAALCANDLAPETLLPLLTVAPERAAAVTRAALDLADGVYRIGTQRQRFWSAVHP